MGISYSACIIVGLPVADMTIETEEDIWDWAYENDLEIVGPYYDAGSEESLIGFIIQSSGDYDWSEINENLNPKIQELKEKFKSITQHDAKVFLSVQGY